MTKKLKVRRKKSLEQIATMQEVLGELLSSLEFMAKGKIERGSAEWCVYIEAGDYIISQMYYLDRRRKALMQKRDALGRFRR